MKKHLLGQLVIASTLLAASFGHGQTSLLSTNDNFQPVSLDAQPPDTRNRISLSYRMGLNITADFRKLGGFTNMTDFGPAAGGATDRNYDNGYNRVDVTGNNHGPGFDNTTWNWGYASGSSVQGNSLVLSSSSSPANGVSNNHNNDPQHGFEITYDRELFRDERDWRYGLEGAFGYTLLSIDDHQTVRTVVNQVNDSFALPSGFVAPPPGYQGTYQGPGPVIGSVPVTRSSTNITSAATIEGERSLDANIFSFRLGPYAEIPLDKKFSLLFSGGLYLAAGEMQFGFREKVTIDGVAGSQIHSGSGSQTDFLVGGYVGGNVEYALTKDVGLFVGAQFQTAGQAITNARGKESILDMGQAVVVSIGASYSF